MCAVCVSQPPHRGLSLSFLRLMGICVEWGVVEGGNFAGVAVYAAADGFLSTLVILVK